MNAILGMAQILDSRQLSESEHHECTRVLLDSASKLLTLLNDILDLARVESGKLKVQAAEMQPVALAREALALFYGAAREKGLQLLLQAEIDETEVYLADETRLRQMLSNLIGNAIKFTERGTVTVGVRCLKSLSGEGPDGLFLEFSVTDTGIGIPEDKAAMLFESFTQLDGSSTRRYGGSGLGLSIVMKLSRLMGGDAGVESRLGEGARFWFRVPAPASGKRFALPGRPDSERQITPVGGGHLLVVEDDATNRRVIELLLAKLGPSIEMVENGREAVDLLASGRRFDIVLMDVRMPVMNGLEASRQIREMALARGLPRIPIVAVTGNAFEDDRKQCFEAGMDDFISKPIRVSDFRRILQRWLPKNALIAKPLTGADKEEVLKALDLERVEAACTRLAQLLDEQLFDAVAVCEALCKLLVGTGYAGRFDGVAESLARLDFPSARSALKAASIGLLSEANQGGGSLT